MLILMLKNMLLEALAIPVGVAMLVFDILHSSFEKIQEIFQEK